MDNRGHAQVELATAVVSSWQTTLASTQHLLALALLLKTIYTGAYQATAQQKQVRDPQPIRTKHGTLAQLPYQLRNLLAEYAVAHIPSDSRERRTTLDSTYGTYATQRSVCGTCAHVGECSAD